MDYCRLQIEFPSSCTHHEPWTTQHCYSVIAAHIASLGTLESFQNIWVNNCGGFI